METQVKSPLGAGFNITNVRVSEGYEASVSGNNIAITPKAALECSVAVVERLAR